MALVHTIYFAVILKQNLFDDLLVLWYLSLTMPDEILSSNSLLLDKKDTNNSWMGKLFQKYLTETLIDSSQMNQPKYPIISRLLLAFYV